MALVSYSNVLDENPIEYIFFSYSIIEKLLIKTLDCNAALKEVDYADQ